MHIHVQGSVWMNVLSFPFGKCLGVEWLDLLVDGCRTFPQWLSHFTVLWILINTWKVSLQVLAFLIDVVSLSGFDLHFPNGVGHYLYVLFCHLCIFFDKMSTQISCAFFYLITASLIFESWKLSIYFRFKSFIKYILRQYFLSTSGSFLSLTVSFEE